MPSPDECYCPICGTKGLEVLRQLHGFTIVWCKVCEIDMAIILEPEFEAECTYREETTH